MSDRIVLSNMTFEGKHGVLDWEREETQPFEVDVEMALDLRPAGRSDDIARTADYRTAFEVCRSVVEGPSRQLIETLAEEIASSLLQAYEGLGIEEVTVRIRKPAVALPGRIDWSGVEIRRRADETGRGA
jgi:7,8-dihydroneopterin aldolase/epimerase/oxygenase